MFQRFHAMKERREGGFTLIELLVVILIIAILAAIAIPVFLAQRRKGWVSQMESTLKNAATSQESFLIENDRYAEATEELGAAPSLEAEGWKPTANVTLAIVSPAVGANDATFYCMTATHPSHPDVYEYRSDTGAPQVGTCAP
jgi:type IV pilus assembly protein PilA